MSGSQRLIVCRGCGAEIPRDGDTCQYCETTIRDTAPVILLLAGVVVTLLSMASLLLNQSVELLPGAVLGVIVGSVGGYMIYDRRRRLLRA